MIELNSEQVADILPDQSRLTADFTFKGITTDSRAVEPGNLFVTWCGANMDGHQFCKQAQDKGAAAVMVTREIDSDIPQIIVDDAQDALGKLTRIWRQTFDIPVIGVTGSNGKTTIKNMLKTIFSYYYGADQVVAAPKSFNNQVGVPLTLAQIGDQTRVAIIEMGTNQHGDIRRLTTIAQPTVTLINNAGRSHLAALQYVEGVARAKAEILEGLAQDGTAILNADDEFFAFWRNQLGPQQQCLSFSMDDEQADIYLESFHVSTSGSSFRAHTPQGDLTTSLPLLGRHNLANALASAGCALAAGLHLETIEQGLQQVEPGKGRFNVHHLPNQITLIDDSYNANPESLTQALDILLLFSGARTIVVMGDMLELGEESAKNHYEMGDVMYYKGVDYLITYGTESEVTQQRYQSYGLPGEHFSDRQALCYHLQDNVKAGDMILFKASNGMQLGVLAETIKERLTQQLTQSPQTENTK